ncbi:hypothetical protein ACWEDZ_04205 [Streptomyces sp. NPDC005047]
MAENTGGDDKRLLALAYVEFWAKRDTASMRLMERDARRLVRSIGAFGFLLMDLVVIPAQHGVGWQDGWVEVDFRRRTDPELRASFIKRSRWMRVARGGTLLPRRRLRRNVHEIAAMLCMAYAAAHPTREESVTVEAAIVEMLGYFRERFCHSGDAHRNA